MATKTKHTALISAQELHAQIDAHVIIDASWHMPATKRNPRAEYASEHIPGAMFFDIEGCCDTASGLPHMLPAAEQFASAMSHIGVSADSAVVVYDATGIFSAPRLWWMLRVFGHRHVRVLDGGLPAWKALYPTHSSANFVGNGRFIPNFVASLVASRAQMLAWHHEASHQICDARSAARFSGAEAEPRAGMRSGHIPESSNLHYARLLTAEGMLKPPELLHKEFKDAGVILGKPIVTSCGSGITACILALALHELGYDDVPVYDGSWAEWGAEANAGICAVAR